MALVYPLKNTDPGQYEGPIDHQVDQLVAFGFFPQKSTTALGSPTSTTGIAYDSGNAFLVIKTEGTKISLQVAGNEYAWLDNTGILSASKLKAVSNLYSPNLDPAAAGALAIGATNATSITIGKSGLPVLHPGGAQAGTMHLNAAIPAAPANGDLWPDGSDVIVRSGGVSRNLSTNTGYRQVVDCGFGVGDGTATAFRLQWSPGCASDAMGVWRNGTKPRTNLLLNSQTIGSWTFGGGKGVRATATDNAGAAPDGTITAEKLTEIGGAPGNFYVTQSVGAVADNATVTASWFVKAAERTQISIYGWTKVPAVSPIALFDLVSSTATMESGTGTPAIVPLGNGWYRCSLSWNVGTGSEGVQTDFSLTSAGSRAYTGVAGNGIYLWGAQLEIGPIATEYIPTTSAAITITPAYWPAMGDGFEPVYEPDGPVSVFLDRDWQGYRKLYSTSRTNLLTYSEQFDNAAWIKGGSSVVANTITAPDGSATADACVSSAADGWIRQTPTLLAATQYTFSAWLKVPSGTRAVNMYASGPVNVPVSLISAQLTAAWQRFSVTVTTVLGGTGIIQVGGANTFGVGAEIHCWGAQFETGVVATPYIPTTTTTVTAPADYTLGPNGLVTLATAPAAGALLSWSGAYYTTDEHAYFDETGRLSLPATDSSGTPGSVTIDSPTGQFAVAAGASSATVTNSSVSATSVVLCVIQSADATLTGIVSVVPGAGSFVFTGNAAATAACKVGFVVVN